MMQLSTNPPIIISTATYGHFPVWDRKLKTLLFLICFFFLSIYSSFHTNDVFILEGFQSNQITMASPLIRHNRTLAEGERQKKTGEHILQYLLKKKKKAHLH